MVLNISADDIWMKDEGLNSVSKLKSISPVCSFAAQTGKSWGRPIRKLIVRRRSLLLWSHVSVL